MKMDVVVVEKCLAFCQGLVESNNKFTFNLSLAQDAFLFDNKELVKSSCEKKKKTPSQLRREKKRKEERKNKKEDTVKVSENLGSESSSFKCDHCEAIFKSEKGLRIHVGKSHKTYSSSTPEKERVSSPEKELLLNLTPAREFREELNNADVEESSHEALVQHKSDEQFDGLDDIELQCDLCDRACISEKKLKVHKAKWHTKVAPLYGNITRQLGFREKFNAECLICGKQFNNSEQHIREDHDFIDEEAISKNNFHESD